MLGARLPADIPPGAFREPSRNFPIGTRLPARLRRQRASVSTARLPYAGRLQMGGVGAHRFLLGARFRSPTRRPLSDGRSVVQFFV